MKKRVMVCVAFVVAAVASVPSAGAQGLTGAVFTTNQDCSGVNLNIFDSKSAVYVNGGPNSQRPGAAGLPDGWYYVQVTEPNDALLGTSIGSGNDAPLQVVNGVFVSCYQLTSIVVKASDGTAGFDTTTNSGGEYKVWVSSTPTFEPRFSKTDNFKVRELPRTGVLAAAKFYDANANGIDDDGQPLTGWQINIAHEGHSDSLRETPVSMTVDPGLYTVSELPSIEGRWMATTPTTVALTIVAGETGTANFGNVCLGAGGGLTLGFWSNKNSVTFATAQLPVLRGLNLRDGAGNNADPGSYTQYRSWLLSASATNMSYMLSAQMTATYLSVAVGSYGGTALVHAPGTLSANALGYARIGALLTEANAELGAYGLVLSDSPRRAYQEALKNAFDRANNNLSFVQATACGFSF